MLDAGEESIRGLPEEQEEVEEEGRDKGEHLKSPEHDRSGR